MNALTHSPTANALDASHVDPPPRRSVLVVEDDEIVSIALLAILDYKGWHVQVARSVAEAKIALRLRPDIVVLDLMLPDGTGVEVMQEIRKIGLNGRVIVTTGLDVNDVQIEQAVAMEPYALLSKPVSLASLFFSMEH